MSKTIKEMRAFSDLGRGYFCAAPTNRMKNGKSYKKTYLWFCINNEIDTVSSRVQLKRIRKMIDEILGDA